jgi:hypothetical protein
MRSRLLTTQLTVPDKGGGAPHDAWCKCPHCTSREEMRKAEEHGPEAFEPRKEEDGIIIKGPRS